MPKPAAALLFAIVASLASGCTTASTRHFNGNDYGDGVYNGGASDRPAYARILHKRKHHHHRH